MKYRQEGDLYKKTTRFLNTRVEKLSFLFQHLEGGKEMRRKLVAMLTAATLVVGMLAGCGGGDSGSKDAKEIGRASCRERV